jgi:hypothetical protein
MTDLEPALQEELGYVPKAELVTQTPEDREQDHIGRELEIVERRTLAFIEAASAGPTGEGTVAKRRTVLSP